MLLVLTARDGACKSRACAPKGSALSLRRAGLYSHCAFGFSSPNDSHTCWTPWSVFQDGSGGSPTYTPQKGATAPEKGRYESGHRDGTVAGPARTPGGPRPRRDGSAHPGLRQPRNGSRRPTKGEVRSWKPARRGQGLAVPDTPAADALRTESPRSTFEVPPVFLSTVSRTLELSLQSSFQLSLTVLVRYRTRGDI